jgi:hypothetical protein
MNIAVSGYAPLRYPVVHPTSKSQSRILQHAYWRLDKRTSRPSLLLMQESELIFSFDATSYFLFSLAVRIVYNSNNVFPQRSKFGGYQKNARLFTLRVKGQKRSESSNPTIISPGTLLVCVHRSGCAYALVCFPLPQICSFDLCYLLSRWFLRPSAPMYAG